MPFSGLLQKILSFAARIKAALAGFFRGQAVQRLLGWIPPERRRLAMIAAAGILAVLLLVIAGSSLFSGGKAGRGESSSSNAAAGAALHRDIIPPDELFLPDEPDFIPGVIPDRERRAQWTAEDAAPWWQDPLKNGEGEWRDRIEKAADEILEGVQ